MDEKRFNELLESVEWMGKHTRGEVQASRAFEYPDPDVKAIRKAVNLSQEKFACAIGVKVKTLQNWEQKRVRPTGPARALLRIVEHHPEVLEDLRETG